MRTDLLRTFAPHFIAGRAGYQRQLDVEAQRESLSDTLVEETDGTCPFFHLLSDASQWSTELTQFPVEGRSNFVNMTAAHKSTSELMQSMDGKLPKICLFMGDV